jgi:uncharacterized protein (TIGR00255 family)
MIRSMTGYGKATGEYKDKIVSAEIKSLNSKFFDLNLRLPAHLRDKELEVRNELNKLVERGKVDFTLTSSKPEEDKMMFNRSLIKSYYREMKEITDDLKIAEPDYMRLILQMPDVTSAEAPVADDDEWAAISKVIQDAVKAFDMFRKAEGANLASDLNERVRSIYNILSKITPFEEERLTLIREKLRSNLQGFAINNEIDVNRYEQELIYYVEKLDISEEKVRLKSHLDYFIETMDEESSGKKLNFITQEIGREINTIGSKANNAPIQKLVVEMKDELERMKEQLSNVL